MAGVQLEHAARAGNHAGIGALGDDALHLKGDGAFRRDARGSLAGACGRAHRHNLLAQGVLHGIKEARVLLACLLGLRLLLLGGKVEVGGGDVGQLEVALVGALVLRVASDGRRVVGTHGLEHELVHVLRAKQHVKAMIDSALDHRGLLQALARVAGRVVDLVLALGHRRDVLGEAHHLVLARGPEEQQVGEVGGGSAVAVVDAKLQAAAKVLEELLVGLAVVAHHGGQLVVHLALDAALDGAELRVVLQRLAADVERDVGAVNHAAHEVVVVRQQVGALLLDQHVGGVQREALLVVLAIEVKRRASRDEQQRVVAQGTLGVKADGARRLLPVVERGGVELVVVGLLHI